MSATFEVILKLLERRDVRISEHGYDELAEDGLTATEIVDGIINGQVIEDYPDYPKGPSVLVTAYRPDPSRWDSSFMERRK
jgi:hypothetical protein